VKLFMKNHLKKIVITVIAAVLVFFVSTQAAFALSLPGGVGIFGGRILFTVPQPTCPLGAELIKVGPPVGITVYVLESPSIKIAIEKEVGIGPFKKKISITLLDINVGGFGFGVTKVFLNENISTPHWVLGNTYPRAITSVVIGIINTVGAPFGIHCNDEPVARFIGTS